MRPVSPAFLRTLRGSHRMVVDATICAPGQTGVNPVGTTIPIVGGDVRAAGTADIRSTVDLTTVGVPWPTSATDLLAPYGNELFVRRGIAYGNGTTEWVSLGYHQVYSLDQDSPPAGPIRIAARDRMAGLIDARLTGPRQYPAAASYGAVVANLVLDVYPTAIIDWDDASDGAPLGRPLTCAEDRHKFLTDLVTGLGKTVWWDHQGHLRIASRAAPSDPVWTVDAGSGGVLVSVSRELSREGVINGVLAIGEAADDTRPAAAVAIDSNPASPTYWYGPFGQVPLVYSSPTITTPAQAQQAAGALLVRRLGLPYSADFTAVPNPALEPDDPVRLTFPGRNELHVVESLTIPLTADRPVTATTREQTTMTIGGW